MKLSFWQEGEKSADFFNRFDQHMQNTQMSYRQDMSGREPYELLKENGDRKLRVPGLQEVEIISDSHTGPFHNISEVRDEAGYKVAVLKKWCEEELTPMAWQRALIRTVPTLREHGYDFDALQHPTKETRINTAYYRVICVTLAELYQSKDSAA